MASHLYMGKENGIVERTLGSNPRSVILTADL